MEALRVEHLSKDYGGVHAVRGVSMSVEVGERLAMIGPNGAGKTTLFNLLSGQFSPTSGSVYLFGRDITHLPAYSRAHLGISRSFQATTLFLNLTVLDNALLALHGTRRSRFHMFRSAAHYKALYARARVLLDLMNLWNKKDDAVHAISYGEQRKLEIVLSLATQPKLLLMDEPSTGLTTAESADIVGIIRKLGKDITVILVAHDMDLVFGVAERIVVLHHGELIIQGTPEEISSHPKVKEIYMGAEETQENA
jgi:branched-chain amino acid transport system ATP-binding protein